jgi:hypothetical protein
MSRRALGLAWAREWLCFLPGRSSCCCLAGAPAPPALLLLPPSALLHQRRCVGRRRGLCADLLHLQECVLVVTQITSRGMHAVARGMFSTTIDQIALTCEREMPINRTELKPASTVVAEATRNGLPFNSNARTAPGWHEMHSSSLRRQRRANEADRGRRPMTARPVMLVTVILNLANKFSYTNIKYELARPGDFPPSRNDCEFG